MDAILTLNRKGDITIAGDKKDDCQCGEKGLRQFYYTVELTCGLDALDESGFIIDQVAIHEAITKYWAEDRNEIPSCERMASETARVVAALCKRFHSVNASVGGKEHAWMSCTLKQERNYLKRILLFIQELVTISGVHLLFR